MNINDPNFIQAGYTTRFTSPSFLPGSWTKILSVDNRRWSFSFIASTTSVFLWPTQNPVSQGWRIGNDVAGSLIVNLVKFVDWPGIIGGEWWALSTVANVTIDIIETLFTG